MDSKCFNCGNSGHIARQCTVKPSSVRSRSCFNCGKEGHVKADCTLVKQQSKQSATPVASSTTKKTYQLVDIGVNLTHKQFSNDLDDVLTRSINAGVDLLVITGTTIRDSVNSQKLAATKPGILFSTAGVHPHNAKECDSKTLDTIRHLVITYPEQVKAVGECGLDFNRMFSPQPVQEEWFEKQIKLAIELKMPLFLHERDAHQSFVNIVQKYPEMKGVVHCFTGTKSEVEKYLSMGFYIGFTGAIFKYDRLQSILKSKIIPLNRMMIETDAPFQSPKRTIRRNEPQYLTEVLKLVAECYGMTEEEVAMETTKTAIEFFKLK